MTFGPRDRHPSGSVTLWVLGLAVSVMFLGGLALDLWRVIELRRSLSATADSVATAGADGLDEAALRRGATLLDPARAERLAQRQLELEDDAGRIDDSFVDATTTEVEVELVGTVELSLLGIFVVGDPIEVHASAVAEPRRSD